MPWYRTTYIREAWYLKNVVKEYTDFHYRETNVGVALDHVTDFGVAIPLDNDLDYFEDYYDTGEDNDQRATDQSEIFKQLWFTKFVNFWCNLEPISPPLLNNLIKTQEQPELLESSSPEEIVQELNELTHYIIV